MATSSAKDIVPSGSFFTRADGDWNYFPWGLSKRGYRVSPKLRWRLMTMWLLSAALVVISCVGAGSTASLICPILTQNYPSIAPYANSAIIFDSAAVAIAAVGSLLVLGLQCVALRLALNRAEPVPPALTEEQNRAMRARRWKELPRRRQVDVDLLLFGLLAASTIGAFLCFRRNTAVSLVEAIILSVGAILVIAVWISMRIRISKAARLLQGQQEDAEKRIVGPGR